MTLLRLALVALAAVFLGGCQTAQYYGQAIGGHWDILSRRQAIQPLLRDPATPERLKDRLRLTQELRVYAGDCLGLPSGNAYTSYVELDRPYVVWNVQAAPEFCLEPKTWCYPVVGRLDYRGYFRESMALDYARQLEAEGYDVCVTGVDAYSTLGWTSDPVLSTFVFLPELQLADLLFHELAHRQLFAPGDTEFNEAFATTVAREGVQRWLETQGRAADLAVYLEEQERDDAVAGLIAHARQNLEELYSRPAPSRAQKQFIFQALRERYDEVRSQWPGYDDYGDWMNGPLNNASLNGVHAYAHWVPAMETLLRGVHHDLPEFYRVMKKIAAMRRTDRHATLRWVYEQERQLVPGS